MTKGLYFVIPLVAGLSSVFSQGIPSPARFRFMPRDVSAKAATAAVIPGLLGNLQTRQSHCTAGFDLCTSLIACCPTGGDCCPGNTCCSVGHYCATGGCCPRGQICSEEISCVVTTEVLCPDQTFCCPPGQICSRAGGIPRCDLPRPQSSSRTSSSLTPSNSSVSPPPTSPAPSTISTPNPEPTTSTVYVSRSRTTYITSVTFRSTSRPLRFTTTSEATQDTATSDASTNTRTSTSSTDRTAIALGSALGGVALLAAASVACFVSRRKSHRSVVSRPDTLRSVSIPSFPPVAAPRLWPEQIQTTANIAPVLHVPTVHDPQLDAGAVSDPRVPAHNAGTDMAGTPTPTDGSFSSIAPMRNNVAET